MDGYAVNEQNFKLPSLGMTQNTKVNAQSQKTTLEDALQKGSGNH